ncbi:hypothetical protein OPIT5_20810 [Opitutaceae bacterium TAV5]|nr:hypothetical protein OPIT5_20810 [Opitutaceae bacterium TAV5]
MSFDPDVKATALPTVAPVIPVASFIFVPVVFLVS